jgi:hypothetical protein
LGGLQIYTDRPDVKEMCALKCKQLKFSFKDGHDEPKISTFKKWTDVPFKIAELEPLVSNNTFAVKE